MSEFCRNGGACGVVNMGAADIVAIGGVCTILIPDVVGVTAGSVTTRTGGEGRSGVVP